MSSTVDQKNRNTKLPPQVNKIIYVRNLPYKITAEQLYDAFGRFGPIRQVRKGKGGDKKGTAFIVYDDIYDAKNAVQNLNGFNVGGSAKRLQLIKQSNSNANGNAQ